MKCLDWLYNRAVFARHHIQCAEFPTINDPTNDYTNGADVVGFSNVFLTALSSGSATSYDVYWDNVAPMSPATGYTISGTAGSHGTISATQTVDYGSNGTTVTAMPAGGYHFVSWSDGYPTAERRDLNVTVNHAVSATFASMQVATGLTMKPWPRRILSSSSSKRTSDC